MNKLLDKALANKKSEQSSMNGTLIGFNPSPIQSISPMFTLPNEQTPKGFAIPERSSEFSIKKVLTLGKIS